MTTLVLDWDGTCTDAERSAAGYAARYEEALLDRIGLSSTDIENLLTQADRRSKEAGWMRGGHDVAPAVVDPYLRCTARYEHVLQALGRTGNDALHSAVFQACYRPQDVVLKEGLGEFLEAARPYSPTIVTNARADKVAHVLAERGIPLPAIIGDAEKYTIDPAWTDVPESVTPPGFPRTVLLRRKRYADALATLGTPAEELTVVGDIYELDLALPEHLGARILHMQNAYTPAHEAAHLAAHAVHDLDEVLARLDG